MSNNETLIIAYKFVDVWVVRIVWPAIVTINFVDENIYLIMKH